MEIKKMKGPSEQRDLMIKQLIEGIEAAKELQKRILISSTKYHHLINDDHNPQLKEDYEALNHSLLDTMLSSFDKTISIAKLMLPLDQQQKQQQPVYNFEFEGSPTHSMGLSSPRSENSHRQQHLSKKRKRMPRWSKMVNVGTTKTISGLEGPLEDGYSWRKYGQKDILGAKFPRAYYRCTHRHTQGCAATKQVQRSDENTSIFHVIYCGEHTCSTGAHLSQAQSKPEKAQIKIEPSPIQSPPEQPQAQTSHYPDQQEIFVGLGSDGSLKVEPAESERPAQLFRSFSFTPVLLESGPTDNFLVDPTFGSPATSDSEHFPMYQIVGHGGGLQVQTSESDFNGTISGPSSVTNSPNGFDFEFLLDPLLDIDAEFHF